MSKAKTTETDTVDSRRPSLQKLTADYSELKQEILQGFSSRRAVLRYWQQLGVYLLGEIPLSHFHKFADEFIADPNGREGVLLSSLLDATRRTRSIPESEARETRRRFVANTIAPAYHRAFGTLKVEATEYVGESKNKSGHDPQHQRYIAMRPAIDELAREQRDTLDVMLTGFDSREGILAWGDRLELAVHGVPIDPDNPGAFLGRCYGEDAVRMMLLSGEPVHARAREHYAAKWLLPAFNRGIRDLVPSAGEEAKRTDRERTVKHA